MAAFEANSQSEAGIQTTGAPIGRMLEMAPATTPSSTGRGTPVSHSPKVVITPCTMAVPSRPNTTPRVTSPVSARNRRARSPASG